jgi:pimeloyl-ACP methyl ester carboxylesterase
LRVIRLADTELHFIEQGSGTPVVLVHGTLGTLDSWRAQVGPLASTFRVVSYSRRYHPPNAARPDGATYAASRHAEDLIAFIDALQLERVHLVGASYGAYVALLVTLRRPDLVRSLVLGEPPLFPWLSRTPAGDSLRRAFAETTLDAARAALARGDSMEAIRRYLVGTGGRPGEIDAGLARLAFALRLELAAPAADYMPPLSCGDVGGIRSPVLLVSGAASPPLFRVATDELARCFPHEEVARIVGAGHRMHAENPRAYNEIVLAFLSRN